MKFPGRKHFQALVHLLHYLALRTQVGIRFYHNFNDSPVASLLIQSSIENTRSVITFSDSSWQDCPDAGRSTGCYVILVQGGVVDISSHVPMPVALSSAEAEYNTAAVACMATSHVRMVTNEFMRIPVDTYGEPPTKILLDSESAIAMSKNSRDSKRTRHIERRVHYVRQGQGTGMHSLEYVPADLQLADIGTKNLSAQDLDPRLNYIQVSVPE